MTTSSEKAPAVHLVNPMAQPGGSELHTLALADLLSDELRVTVWSTYRHPDPSLTLSRPVRRILGRVAPYPRGGTLVVVGAYIAIKGGDHEERLSEASPSRACDRT